MKISTNRWLRSFIVLLLVLLAGASSRAQQQDPNRSPRPAPTSSLNRTAPANPAPKKPDDNRNKTAPKYVAQAIQYLDVQADTIYADFTFRTTQPTIPIINISKRPPKPGPKFDQTVSGSFPIFAKGVFHNLRVSKLEPRTRYYYIVTVADNQGKLLTETGTFKTAVNID